MPSPTDPLLMPQPGIRLDRRAVFWLPVALPAAGRLPALAAPLRAPAEEAGAFSPLSRAAFGERWQALAAELLGSPPEHDESYAAQLAGLVARVPPDVLPRLPASTPARDGVAAGPSWLLLPALTVEFRMEPGASLRLHNHPPQVVLTLCAEGEARYRHLEPVGAAPPCTKIDGATFTVRETREGILTAGRSTALTRTRDGIHGFTAGEHGARLIDFTLSLTDDIETFSYLELEPEPRDPARGLYAARWTGTGR